MNPESKKRYEDAIICCDKALQMNPASFDAWNAKALSLYHMMKYKEAIDCFDNCIALRPDTAQVAYKGKGSCLANLGLRFVIIGFII